MSKPILRLVASEGASAVPMNSPREDDSIHDTEFDLAVRMIEIASYERTNGPNTYTRFALTHGHLPSPDQARVIGLTIGRRVRADDGKMYPPKTKSERKAASESRLKRKRFEERFARSARLYAAVRDLAEMDLSPEEIEIFYLHDRKIETKLHSALEWLTRFASLRVSNGRHTCSEHAKDRREISC